MVSFLERYSMKNIILMGCRRTDPGMSRCTIYSDSDNGYPPFKRVFPLLDWDNKTIWDLILKANVEIPSLYSAGNSSLGTMSDTIANPKLINGNTALPAWLLLDEFERLGRL